MGNYTGAISTFNAVQPRDEYAWYNLGITQMYFGGHPSRQGSIGVNPTV